MTTNRKFIWSHLLSWWITCLPLFLFSYVGRIMFVKFTLVKCFQLLSIVDFCRILLKFDNTTCLFLIFLGNLFKSSVSGEEQKKIKIKWHRAFNQLKPTWNWLGWNLETARHNKYSSTLNPSDLFAYQIIYYYFFKKNFKKIVSYIHITSFGNFE